MDAYGCEWREQLHELGANISQYKLQTWTPSRKSREWPHWAGGMGSHKTEHWLVTSDPVLPVEAGNPKYDD